MDSISEHHERAVELIDQALDLENGDERIAVSEDAVREADLSGNLELRYRAREACVRAQFLGGAPEKSLVNFSWLLATFDQNPGQFSEWAILWKYKWMVVQVSNFPQISKPKIYEMLDDLEARSLKAGYGRNAIFMLRYRLERFWDDKPRAAEYFLKMLESTTDDLSNCPACTRNEFASYAIYSGNDARGVELAQTLLDGENKCATVPHRTYAELLLSMVRLGRQQEALNYHRAGYRLIASNRRFLDYVAEHLIFLALTENFARAVELFEKHYPWTEDNYDSFDLFHFSRAAWLLFEMVAERGTSSLNLKMPRSFPHYSVDGNYHAAELAEVFKEKADDLAARFDARNETDFFSRTMRETPGLKIWCAPFPLREVE